MEDMPDLASTNSPNINSVLKPPKPRVPLKDLLAVAPDEDNTAARKRRVSFANVNRIKEFSAGAESMVVCHTPAYEEPFSLSSDSSYPSGVDGWTPAKGQPSMNDRPLIYTEKENILIENISQNPTLSALTFSQNNVSDKSSRMSTGMNFTSAVGYGIQNSRYSVNGMDLTDVANTYEAFRDQQSRFSIGMDLTNLGRQSIQNTRYSINGMDFTETVDQQETFRDERTRFSMGMDLTNAIGHSLQNLRHSVTGMDLTEAVNPEQTFQRSSKLSLGMDMTSVVSSSTRYSCNEIDLTEGANNLIHPTDENQSCGDSANMTMNDSDGLELTEAVIDAQVSAASSKCRISDLGATENVLYSVNNTRYSMNSMDITRAAVSHHSNTRRKSSRYSLVNMDITEAIGENCDDLDFTEVIRDPRIRAESARFSMSEMDLTEVANNDGVTQLSGDNMDCTDIGREKLEYSADTESGMNLTNSVCNSDLPSDDKENILPVGKLEYTDIKTLPQENCVFVNSKLATSVKSIVDLNNTADKSLPGLNLENSSNSQEIMVSKHQIKESESCKLSTNEDANICEGLLVDKIVPKEFERKLVNITFNEKESAPNEEIDNKSLHTNLNPNESIKCPPLQGESDFVENTVKNNTTIEDKNYVIKESVTVLEPSVEYLKNDNALGTNFSLCLLKYKNTNESGTVEDVLRFNDNEDISEVKLNEPVSHIQECNINREENVGVEVHQQSCSANFTLLCESKNDKPNNKQSNESAMDISVTENNEIEGEESNICNVESSAVVDKFDNIQASSQVKLSLENCSLTKEFNEIENIEEQGKKADFNENTTEKNISVLSESMHHVSNSTDFREEPTNPQTLDDRTAAECQSIELSNSVDTSLYVASTSLLHSENITFTRGTSQSISKNESNIGSKIVNTSSVESSSVDLEVPRNVEKDQLSQSQNSLRHESSSSRHYLSREKTSGKRSFEVALEPENDTEESPVKQLCVESNAHADEFEGLNNITAPSFLMTTLSAPNETVSSLDQRETSVVTDDQVNGGLHVPNEIHVKNIDFSLNVNKISASKQENNFSLRMDDESMGDRSPSPPCQEVIDLCESSMNTTSTDVVNLLNKDFLKEENVKGAEDMVSISENERFNLTLEEVNTSQLEGVHIEKTELSHITRLGSGGSAVINKALEREVEQACLTEKVDFVQNNLMSTPLQFTSRGKKEKIKTSGNGIHSAEFVPNVIEIQFSNDPFNNILNANFSIISPESSGAIGQYLLYQARNALLPEKISDLIDDLETANKSFLSRLARNINMICKYHNGTLKGNMLTLELASCKNQFWTFIDINIKRPQYLSPTDISISEQRIGELKLAQVRKVFSSIEKDQDQLLNFVKAMSKLQY